jgi:Protein of unknown function (DUF3575)
LILLIKRVNFCTRRCRYLVLTTDEFLIEEVTNLCTVVFLEYKISRGKYLNMTKHIKRFLVVIVCALPLFLNSTVSAAPTSAITMNLFQAAFGTFSLQYETALSPSGALVIQGEYGSWGIGDWSVTTMGAGVGYRFYPGAGTAPSGLWVGPLIRLANVSADYGGEVGSTMYFTGGAEFGYQWLFGEETAFALGLSLGIYYVNGTISVGTEDLNYGGVLPGLGLNLGIGF